MSDDYLREAYLGEIGGEAYFRSLAEVLPDRATALNLLAEVEQVTAEYLEPHLQAPVSENAVAERRAQGSKVVAAQDLKDWTGFLQSALPVVEQALAMMQKAEADAPENLLAVYQTYTAHEQALADYLRLERVGEDGTRVLEAYLQRVGSRHAD